MRRTLLALAIAGLSFAALLPVDQMALAARPPDKPPVLSTGPSVAMESGKGMLFSDFNYGDQHVAFSYPEVRHVSLTVTRTGASTDPLASFFVYRKIQLADGSTADFVIAIIDKDHNNAVLEFDADDWHIQGAPGSDVAALDYSYTVTFPAMIQ